MNKLHEFAKRVEQANRLADLGFSLVYLLVFVLVDSCASEGDDASAIDSLVAINAEGAVEHPAHGRSTKSDFRGVIFVNASSRRSAEFGLQIAVDSRERHAEKTHFLSARRGRR